MHRVSPDSPVRLTFALLLAGCSATTQRAFEAPSSETIVSETEERQSDPPTHLIFVKNLSTVPVKVFSVSLRSCENVKQPCGPKSTNLRVAPGQRVLALRVEPDMPQRAFSYNFGFSWHADSSSAAALAALAASGDASARRKVAAMQRDDSLRKAEPGTHYNELTRDDFTALGGRVVSMRAEPESLVLAPGEQSSVERIQFLMLDAQGQSVGRTRWVQWMVPGDGAIQFLPPDRIIAHRPGRTVIRFRLAGEAQQMLRSEIPDVEVPIVVAYRLDAHAPVFAGRVADAESRRPLTCVRVVLEDSAQNVVSSGRTGAGGTFRLQAPRAGTYRVAVHTHGWAPAYGPTEVATAGEAREREYLVRFTEQLLIARYGREVEDFQHAHPAAVTTEPLRPRSTGASGGAASTPVISGVTLGGSDSNPILGIVSRTPRMTTWVQFVVDSTGRVDATSILLPPDTPASAKASVTSVLPRVRFSPARDKGTPTCEMLRMQVNFTSR